LFVLSGFETAYSVTSSNALDLARNRIVPLYPSAWTCATFTVLTLFAFQVDQLFLFKSCIRSIVRFADCPYADDSYPTPPIELFFSIPIFLLLVIRSVTACIGSCLVSGCSAPTANVYLWHSIYAGVIRVSHIGLWLIRHIDHRRVRFMLLVRPDRFVSVEI
jgi:hypothetical protein